MRQFTCTSVVALLFCSASPAAAEDSETADSLFKTAIPLMEAKDFEAACPKLAESLRLDRKPGKLHALAICEKERGRWATALMRIDEFLWLVNHMPDDAKLKYADKITDLTAERSKLEPQIPRLTMKLPANVAPDVVVTLDAEPMNADQLNKEIFLDPGTHVVTTQVPGGMTKIVRVHLLRGDKRDLRLEVPPPSFALEHRAKANSTKRGAGIAFGIGGAFLVVGAVFTGIMVDNSARAKANCDPNGMCTDTGIAAIRAVHENVPIVTVGLVGGFMGLGLGTLYLVTAPKSPAPQKAESGLGAKDAKGGPKPPMHTLEKQWALGVLSSSPSGAIVGLRGTW